tara:strand:+ start:3788 stop:3967 length:180 start_codon:yes stop_codon:yes gene_type:complete
MNNSELIALWYEEFYVKREGENNTDIHVEFITFKKNMVKYNYDFDIAIEKIRESYYNKM